MLILSIDSKVHKRTGTKSDGSTFEVTFQEGEILYPNRRPRVIEVSPPRNDRYVEGFYTLDARSFRTDDYDRLILSKYSSLIGLEEAISQAQDVLKSRDFNRKRA